LHKDIHVFEHQKFFIIIYYKQLIQYPFPKLRQGSGGSIVSGCLTTFRSPEYAF